MTPEQLFNYCNKFCERSIKKGEGSKYPTFVQVAKRFNVKYDEIENTCDNYSGDGYLGVVVAVGIGSGVYEFRTRGEYQVEAYND